MTVILFISFFSLLLVVCSSIYVWFYVDILDFFFFLVILNYFHLYLCKAFDSIQYILLQKSLCSGETCKKNLPEITRKS